MLRNIHLFLLLFLLLLLYVYVLQYIIIFFFFFISQELLSTHIINMTVTAWGQWMTSMDDDDRFTTLQTPNDQTKNVEDKKKIDSGQDNDNRHGGRRTWTTLRYDD